MIQLPSPNDGSYHSKYQRPLQDMYIKSNKDAPNTLHPLYISPICCREKVRRPPNPFSNIPYFWDGLRSGFAGRDCSK